MIKTIEKNGLRVRLNTEHLEHSKQSLLEYITDGTLSKLAPSHGKEILEVEFEDAVERLYQLAYELVDENKSKEDGFNIIDYLPITKSGKFHKKNPILVATSGIKDIDKGDYFSMYMLDLYLTPHVINAGVYPREIDTTAVDVHLGFHSRSTGKEVPIFDGNNHPEKVQPTKYIDKKDVQIGHMYKDIKGRTFMYAGCLFMTRFKENTKADAMASEQFSAQKKRYYYIKMTKKMETLIEKNNLKTLDDIIRFHLEDTPIMDYYQSALRFVEDCNQQLITETITKDWYKKTEGGIYVQNCM